MKKVLIIGFMWPYHNRGGGRLPGLAKYISEFGWEPVVITAPLDNRPEKPFNYRIIETPYKNAIDFWLKLFRLNSNANSTAREQMMQRFGAKSKRSLRRAFIDFATTRFLEIIDYPDLDKTWQPVALKTCDELWQESKFDAVISSSPPETAHLIAKKLKAKYKIPWVADFPHLWSQDNSYTYSSLRRAIDRRLELKTLASADALVAVSGPLADKLKSLHRDKRVLSIAHGFDPETENTRPDKLNEKFSITYTGSLEPKLREPDMLFAALKDLLSKGTIARDRMEVRFYGQTESWLDEEINKYGLQDMVKQYGRVPAPEARVRQRESQILFNPKWNDPKEPGMTSMKMLEYLAAKRPILATGKYKDVVDDMLKATGTGVCVYTVEETIRALQTAYAEFLQKGAVTWHGKDSEVEKYSHRGMAKQFAELLYSLANG